MSELGDKRKLMTRCLVILLSTMLNKNFKPMIGKDGLKHMTGSLHYEGLAIDIDLCDSNGVYLSDTESHRQFGELWKSLDPACRWGGDFNDGNHYSITYGGKA